MAEPVPTAPLSSLAFPRPGVDVADDAVVPLDALLQSLQLVASDRDRDDATRADRKWDDPTPPSMQVIKSGTLDITKAITKQVRAAGGVSAVLAAGIASLNPVLELGTPITVALIAAVGLILSAAAISLALVVRGDLEARGVATAARHQGRAEVAASFLVATAAMPSKKAGATAEHGVSTQRSDGAGDGSAAARDGFAADLLAALAAYPDTTTVTTTRHHDDRRVDGLHRARDGRLVLDSGSECLFLEEVTGFRSQA